MDLSDLLADDLLSDDVDFMLAGEDGPTAAIALLEQRQAIAAWSARALVARCPAARPYRGHKGILACEQDHDFHLQHLYDAAAAEDGAGLARYAGWIVSVLQRRGVEAQHVRASIDVLCEGLLRYLPWPHGRFLAGQLREAFR